VKYVQLVFVIALSSGLTSPAAADTTRGCKAVWEVRSGNTTRQFGGFEARGRCRGKAWANDCRRAARGYAQSCFRSAWANRWVDSIRRGDHLPPNCVGRGDIGVRGYPRGDLKTSLERQACSMQRAVPFKVQVIGRTYDGKRCDGEVLLAGTYEITDAMCGKQ
jgi:hypothetical protein